MVEPGLGLPRMLVAEHEVADHREAGILAGPVAGPRGLRLQHAGGDRVERLEHAGDRARRRTAGSPAGRSTPASRARRNPRSTCGELGRAPQRLARHVVTCCARTIAGAPASAPPTAAVFRNFLLDEAMTFLLPVETVITCTPSIASSSAAGKRLCPNCSRTRRSRRSSATATTPRCASCPPPMPTGIGRRCRRTRPSPASRCRATGATRRISSSPGPTSWCTTPGSSTRSRTSSGRTSCAGPPTSSSRRRRARASSPGTRTPPTGASSRTTSSPHGLPSPGATTSAAA